MPSGSFSPLYSPSLKLTWPRKIGKVIFQPLIFRGELVVSGRVPPKKPAWEKKKKNDTFWDQKTSHHHHQDGGNPNLDVTWGLTMGNNKIHDAQSKIMIQIHRNLLVLVIGGRDSITPYVEGYIYIYIYTWYINGMDCQLLPIG